MLIIKKPEWEDLTDLVNNAKHKLIICTPFYKGKAIEALATLAGKDISLILIIKISPSDWAKKVADPEKLMELLDFLSKKNTRIKIYENNRLHAKIFVADKAKALIGSMNLTRGGFEGNLEVLLGFDDHLSEILSFCKTELIDKSSEVEISDLRKWVKKYAKQICQLSKKDEYAEAKELKEAQRSLDKFLVKHRRPIVTGIKVKVTESLYSDFTRWIKSNQKVNGAKLVYRRIKNLDKQNLQGHVKQSFFASYTFLKEIPQLGPKIISEFLADKKMYEPGPEILADWQEYFNLNATRKETGFDMAILRGILPPSLGGTRSNGGGGSSTFKRVLPLVAKYLLEKV